MTKEKLVKEAKDSWWNDNNCSGALPTEKIYECGYLAGAEPREKHIAELEKKNKVLTQNLEDTEIINNALEKENAELKEKVNILDNCDRLGDVITEAYKEQLTKAKELLRYYFDCFKNDNKYTLSDFEVVEDTEQFLNSEVEK